MSESAKLFNLDANHKEFIVAASCIFVVCCELTHWKASVKASEKMATFAEYPRGYMSHISHTQSDIAVWRVELIIYSIFCHI